MHGMEMLNNNTNYNLPIQTRLEKKHTNTDI